jgi:hypothetical protein
MSWADRADLLSSWPASCRPSTSFLAAPKTWMAAPRAAMTLKRRREFISRLCDTRSPRVGEVGAQRWVRVPPAALCLLPHPHPRRFAPRPLPRSGRGVLSSSLFNQLLPGWRDEKSLSGRIRHECQPCRRVARSRGSNATAQYGDDSGKRVRSGGAGPSSPPSRARRPVLGSGSDRHAFVRIGIERDRMIRAAPHVVVRSPRRRAAGEAA